MHKERLSGIAPDLLEGMLEELPERTKPPEPSCETCGLRHPHWQECAEAIIERAQSIGLIDRAASASQTDGEICKRCFQPVAQSCPTWWSAPDDLWLQVYGTTGGIRCIPCFTKDCAEKGITIYWQAVED